MLDERTPAETNIPTLNEIVIGVSPHFQVHPVTAAIISNIVTYIATSKVSMLQIALGLFVNEKKFIKCFQELGVTSSYDEINRFKLSVDQHVSATGSKTYKGLQFECSSEQGLGRFWVIILSAS